MQNVDVMPGVCAHASSCSPTPIFPARAACIACMETMHVNCHMGRQNPAPVHDVLTPVHNTTACMHWHRQCTTEERIHAACQCALSPVAACFPALTPPTHRLLQTHRRSMHGGQTQNSSLHSKDQPASGQQAQAPASYLAPHLATRSTWARTNCARLAHQA